MMKNSRSLIIGMLISGGVGACSPVAPVVTITPLGAERTYPATPDSVSIPLYSVSKPDCPYDEIAVITTTAPLTRDAKLVTVLRQKARALGADAIIGYTQKIEDTVNGTAIRFRSAQCTK
jgi:hypothetical protein